MSTYKQFIHKPLEERSKLSAELLVKHPTRIPVIITRMKSSDPPLDRFRYLVPGTMTVGNFMFGLKKRLTDFKATDGMFVCSGNMLLRGTDLFDEIYQYYRNKFDNFLYLTYGLENSFGGHIRE